MSLDLSRLSPAPWSEGADEDAHIVCSLGAVATLVADTTSDDGDAEKERAHAQFIALARNALDVQLRRDWMMRRHGSPPRFEICVPAPFPSDMPRFIAADPFSPWVEADEWMKANVEKGPVT